VPIQPTIQPTLGGLRVANLVLVKGGPIFSAAGGKVRRSPRVAPHLNCEFT
jgi:hypothetical protein